MYIPPVIYYELAMPNHYLNRKRGDAEARARDIGAKKEERGMGFTSAMMHSGAPSGGTARRAISSWVERAQISCVVVPG
ncbi:hypothetical protein Tco_1174075 [Tanacetum coccineum]